MIRRIIEHLKARRNWNRTRRWMRNHAHSRCLISLLIANGGLRKQA